MDKSPEAFRTISEVAEALDVPPHVLRFWETRFAQVKPVKRGGGRRYYRPEDVRLLRGIRGLLYDDGMTIKGVQKILRERGIRHVIGLGTAARGRGRAAAARARRPPPAGAARRARRPSATGAAAAAAADLFEPPAPGGRGAPPTRRPTAARRRRAAATSRRCAPLRRRARRRCAAVLIAEPRRCAPHDRRAAAADAAFPLPSRGARL